MCLFLYSSEMAVSFCDICVPILGFFSGTKVVDHVLEDIRLGMEVNLAKIHQRRVSMIKYFGELYNYRLVESSDVFKVCTELMTV